MFSIYIRDVNRVTGAIQVQFLIDKRASPAVVEDVKDEGEQDRVQGERRIFFFRSRAVTARALM